MNENLDKVSGMLANAVHHLRQANSNASAVESIAILAIIRKACEAKQELENLRAAIKLDSVPAE